MLRKLETEKTQLTKSEQSEVFGGQCVLACKCRTACGDQLAHDASSENTQAP